MTPEIYQLAIMIMLAAGLGVAARLLKQPIFLAYLATGVIIGYFGFFELEGQAIFSVFGNLGIMFLLFLIGIEINYGSLRMVGKTALLLGLGQIVLTFSSGYGLAKLLGYSSVSGIYIGLALSFASTIVVVKLLSEKKDIGSLYGKMSVGVLLVQDIVAVLTLVVLGGLSNGQPISFAPVAVALLKGISLFALMLWLGRKVLPFVFDRVARSQELLFIISLAWVFAVGALVSRLGFSLEIAGLLAGLALANSAEHFQIAGKIRSLRDFFILIFFVTLGASLVGGNFGGLWPQIVVLSLFVLFATPAIVFLMMSVFGYRKRTSFMTGLMFGQISEFSLILAAMGLRLNHIEPETASLITAVGVITIAMSSYAIINAETMFKKMVSFLRHFERKNLRERGTVSDGFAKPFILVGANRTGESIARHLPEEDLLVIDFDPDVIAKISKKGIDHIFGDVIDEEIFEKANFNAARLVISTSPDLHDNLELLDKINALKKRPRVIIRGENEKDAAALYKAGADYVLLPHFTSGQYLGKTLAVDSEMKVLENLRATDMEMMGREY